MNPILPRLDAKWSLLLVLLGCACSPSVDLEGKWIGERHLVTAPGTDPAITKTLSKVELRVDNHSHFTLFEHGLPKTGTLTQSDGKAYLQIEEIVGQPKPKGAEDIANIELTPDGKDQLTYRDPAIPNETVTMNRISKTP